MVYIDDCAKTFLPQLAPVVMIMVFCNVFRKDTILERSYEKIKLGDSLEEVQAIIPGEGGEDYRFHLGIKKQRGPIREVDVVEEEGDWITNGNDKLPGRLLRWQGWDIVLAMRIDAHNRVTDKMIIRLRPLTLVERINQIFY